MRNFDIPKDDIMTYAEGQWPAILAALCGELSEAVSKVGKVSGNIHSSCPFPERHGKSNGKGKFRLSGKSGVYNGSAICSCGSWNNGVSLIMDINGLSLPEAMEEINNHLGDPCGADEKRRARNGEVFSKEQSSRYREQAKERRKAAEHAAKKRHHEAAIKAARNDKYYKKNLSDTWAGVVDISDHTIARPAWLYLKNRGINPKILTKIIQVGFHPALPYFYEGKHTGNYPAIVSLFRDGEGKPATLHRIYITKDGYKADLPSNDAKKVMPSPSTVDISGGAIMLCNYKKRVLGLAEGLETALAVYSVSGLPTWPTYSAGLLGNFNIAAFIGKLDLLVIWADHDISNAGITAAKKIESQAKEVGIEVLIMTPDCFPIPDGAKGIDWLDVLNIHGKDAFPDMAGIVRSILSVQQSKVECIV